MAPPANDDFADAVTLVGASGLLTGQTNVDATIETGEPAAIGSGTRTIWYKITPSGAQPIEVTLSTVGGSYAFAVDVWTGAAVGDLNLVQSNDNNINTTVPLMWLAEASVTYYVRVDGYFDSAASDIRIAWELGDGYTTLLGDGAELRVLEGASIPGTSLPDESGPSGWTGSAFDDSGWDARTNGLASTGTGASTPDGRELPLGWGSPYTFGVTWRDTLRPNYQNYIRGAFTCTQDDLDAGVFITWGWNTGRTLYVNGGGSTWLNGAGEILVDITSECVLGPNVVAIYQADGTGDTGAGPSDGDVADAMTWVKVQSLVAASASTLRPCVGYIGLG